MSTINDANKVDGLGFNAPRSIYKDINGKLYVADMANNRVLIWNTVPTNSNTPASVVLGQPDMSSTTANNGGISGSSLNLPRSVYSDGTKLYVADQGNNRVLIWNTIPTVNNMTADVVLGQLGFTTGTANYGGISASSLYVPA